MSKIYFYTLSVALFFAGWAFFQAWYMKRVAILQIDDIAQDKLAFLFAMIVPLVVSIVVCIFFLFNFKESPTKSIVLIREVDFSLFWLLMGSAACLTISYCFYPFVIKESIANAAFVTVGITLILFVCFLFIKFNHGEIEINQFIFQENIVQIIGAAVTVLGLILIKIDDIKAVLSVIK